MKDERGWREKNTSSNFRSFLFMLRSRLGAESAKVRNEVGALVFFQTLGGEGLAVSNCYSIHIVLPKIKFQFSSKITTSC